MALKRKLIGVGVETEVASLLGTNVSVVTTYKEMAAANQRGDNLLIFNTITLTANTTISTDLAVLRGGLIVTNGFTLTLSGSLDAGAYQIFNASSGSVVFANGKVCDHLHAEWWGALGDGSTDDTTEWQAAINAARVTSSPGTGNIPIQACAGRTYMINSLYLPAFTVIRGQPIRKSAAAFKCNTTSATMFVIDGDDRYSEFITLDGIYIDGDNKATSLLRVEDAGHLQVNNCQLYNAVTNAVLLENNAIWCLFENCEVLGSYTYGFHLTGDSCNANTIRDCHLSGTSITHAIYTDSSWAGDTLVIENCSIESGGCTNVVNLDHANSGGTPTSTGNKVSLVRCRFDTSATNAHVKVVRYTWGVNIYDCRMVDPCTYNIETDANFTNIRDCYLADATSAAIRFGANSGRCTVGPMHTALSVSDATSGTGVNGNWVHRRSFIGDGSGRPSPYFFEQGYIYLDTGLDADGLPIFWTGTKWIKADGTNA